MGTVTVTGWAFDWDKVSAPLDIHVYIGGEAGTGEGHGNGVANQSRPDVNKVYVGAGDNHGFSHTVTTGKRGQQTVFVYAINASGTPGVNVLIGKATVDIKSAAPASYTVTYDANGGSGAPAAQTKTEGQDLKLAAALPSNGSLFFIAWNTKKDGTGDTYKPGDTYKANASVTLYAQWTPVKTGDLNGDGKVDYKDLQMLWQILRG
ncbi:MAG: InlB B-repeat-containing protein [Firmicutes bacterium]|nr:InlB B-repeat-containing protein [Bacillota bacterium]